ncbi:MAG: DNA methyltransferase [Candidatus Hydromicrobium sp.]
MERIPTKQIIEDKKNGLSDKEIGDKYRVNLKFIERVITKETGINISYPSNIKKINKLYPKYFNLENTSVWSFKSRGNWASHNGNYRGNWSPYIPRNIILRYSEENDLVLDYFCGAGSTAVECKLLGRNFIGVDINSKAVELAKTNLDFGENNIFFNSDIVLKVGDARNLEFIDNSSVDLICAHPPYSNIINYTYNNPDDLSNYKVDKFIGEIEKVAKESYRILRDKKYCAILIGDMRKNKNVIPLGFWTIRKYLEAGFSIEELIIKRQHNCKTTGFWYTNSIKYNFLLLAHEYLVVFKKTKNAIKESRMNNKNNFIQIKNVVIGKDVELESKTVWVFTKDNWLNKTISNLVKRYSNGNFLIYNGQENLGRELDLVIIFYNERQFNYFNLIKEKVKRDGILAIICEDCRLNNNLLFPTATTIEGEFNKYNEFKIKEIVIVSIENGIFIKNLENLEISHKNILIYKKS